MSQVTDPSARPATFEQFLASITAGPAQGGPAPGWLHQVIGTLFHGQDPAAATGWARRLYDLLDRTDPPFAVMHDWQARTVIPLMAQACHPAEGEPAEQADAAELPDAAALHRLHARAAGGERFDQAEWRAAIEPVLLQVYRHAYGYAEAYATAHASASGYAQANNFSPDGAVRFADSYAADSTDANRAAFAESNAVANAAVLAAAYASGDAQAYAEAYPFALLNACAHASANRAEPAAGQAGDSTSDRATRRRAAYARLAGGLADSLARLG